METRRRRILIGAAAIALLCVAAYAGFSIVQKRETEAQVRQVVIEAAARLQPALAVDINAPTVAQLKALDAAIMATEASLRQLRSAGVRQPPLVDAADEYVASVLNVLKRQAGSLRGRQRFTDSHRALTAHLALAGQRGSQWLEDAVRLRRQMDHAYFDYNTATTSLGNMLAGYPASLDRIAELLPSVSLPPVPAAREAHRRTLAAAEATRGEHERAKQLVAPG